MKVQQAWQVRCVALATLAYSTAIVVAPKVLAGPCGLTDKRGRVPAEAAALIRSMGARDAALAALLAIAPAGRSMHALTAARVASDGADAFWFASLVPGSQRVKIAGAAVAWALIELGADVACNR